MSLLSIDIAQAKRLSLKEAKLPAPEVKERGNIKPIQVERPPSAQDIAYSKLVALNPTIEALVERLELVSIKTGERPKKVELKDDHKPEPEASPQEPVDSSKLIALANKVIKPRDSYTKEEVVARIKEATNVDQERAERGFYLMLQAGAITQIIKPELYYLGGSTPF